MELTRLGQAVISDGHLRRSQLVPSRFIEFKQYLEPNHIRSKTYLEFLDAKRKIFRR